MNETYTYRRTPSRGVVLVAALGVLLLGSVAYVTGGTRFYWAAGLAGAVTLGWALLPRPVYGIKVDDNHLTLGAWRNPRHIPLDQISHLRATNVSDETKFAVVYKDGEHEAIFSLDLPDEDTLVEIMAERGIPVRGNF